MGGPLEVAMQRAHPGGVDRGLGEPREQRRPSLRERARGTFSKFLGSSKSPSKESKTSGSSSRQNAVSIDSPSNDEDFGPGAPDDDNFGPRPESHQQDSKDGKMRQKNVQGRKKSVGSGYHNELKQAKEVHSGEQHGEPDEYPDEFMCPILKKLMAEPVNVGSGISYERVVIQLYFQKGMRRCIKTGVILESDAFLKNFSLKVAIDNWCDSHGVSRPVPPSLEVAKDAVERLWDSSRTDSFDFDYFSSSDVSTSEWSRPNSGALQQIQESELANSAIVPNRDGGETPKKLVQPPRRSTQPWNHTWSEAQSKPSIDAHDNPSRQSRLESSDFEDQSANSLSFLSAASSSNYLVIHTASPRHSSAVSTDSSRGSMPLPLRQTPASYGSSEDAGARVSADGTLGNDVIDSLIFKLGHRHVKEQEEAVVELRRITRISARHRVELCEEKVFVPLLQLLQSRYSQVQINSVAAVMNLSLERENKLKVARFGAIPYLIDVLKSGVPEAQEHAAGAIFSLSLNDENKMAIGVLGAIPPLIHLLRTGEQGARRDAAMALYHLSFSQMNRSKLVKAGGVGTFLGIVKDERSDVVSRALLILCNIAAMQDGRVALAEKDAVPILVNLLTKGDDETSEGAAAEEHRVNWPEVREHAAAALLLLSQNFRFRAQALQAGALEGLQRLEVEGTPRAREKAAALLEILRESPQGQEVGLDNQATHYPRRAFNRPGVDISKAESSVF